MTAGSTGRNSPRPDGLSLPNHEGMTLTLNIIMSGAITVAAFNPARALGPMVATGNFSGAWLYLTVPIVGAIVAAIVHIAMARLAQERTVMSEPDVAARTAAE